MDPESNDTWHRGRHPLTEEEIGEGVPQAKNARGCQKLEEARKNSPLGPPDGLHSRSHRKVIHLGLPPADCVQGGGGELPQCQAGSTVIQPDAFHFLGKPKLDDEENLRLLCYTGHMQIQWKPSQQWLKLGVLKPLIARDQRPGFPTGLFLASMQGESRICLGHLFRSWGSRALDVLLLTISMVRPF